MEDRTVLPGQKYRHFKDRLYRVLCVARHSVTFKILCKNTKPAHNLKSFF